MKILYLHITIILTTMLAGACMPTGAEHAAQLQSQSDRTTTVGVVQKEISKGMSQAEVAAALGSPNIVSKDKSGLETWIYDKIATEVSYSTAKNGLAAIFIGSRSTGAMSQTQKTLTVIIKFKDNAVHDFSYHSSKF